MKVKTNNVPRDVIEAYELTEQEREEFDYLDWDAIDNGEDSATFLRYKGELYDLSEFEAIPHRWVDGWRNWHGYQSDSFFSGLVIRFTDDFEQVTVGRYMT